VRAEAWQGVTFMGDGALFPPAAASPAGAADATQWPSESPRPGAYTEARTDAGLEPDESTEAGLAPPRPPRQTAVAMATPLPPSPTVVTPGPDVTRLTGHHAIDPDATMMRGPDVTMTGAPDATRADVDRTRLGMPKGLVVKPTDGPSGPLDPGTPFGPRYHIVQLLGLGGMGAVYKAWDAELGVLVALKVIRPEIAADPKAAAMLERRFKQELLLARQVTHKNVVRIHELGEIDGIKFLTMPFIEGEELASIIQRNEKLPIGRIMKIARGIATGLEAAHAAGVVHRDLKPANIMVDRDDEAMIMDFGIARSTAGSGQHSVREVNIRTQGGWSANQTMVGAVVGTVQYMAPEQARAQPVDQRADIYAFGLIVYDMLLNKQRASGSQTALEELQARMNTAPPSPRTIDATIPEPLNQLVAKCIEPDATKRFQTTPELVAALNRLDDRGKLIPITRRLTKKGMAAAAAGVALLLGGTYYVARGPEIPVEHEPVALIIADFQNETGDPEFDRALEPVLKLALEGAGFITAYDRGTIPRALGVRAPEILDEAAAVQLAVKQGVGVVVSGTLTKAGNRYGIAMKVAESVSGKAIAEQAETASDKNGVVGALTSLAGDVREALGDTTEDTAQRYAMETLSATSLEVVRAYSKGMDAMSRSQFNDAAKAFRQTTEIDPNFGLAYGGMAMALNNLGRRQEAESSIKEAISRVDSMTERERYRTRGTFYTITEDYQACVKEYSDLIAKYSADTMARNNRAVCLSKLRQMPTAVKEMQDLLKILPNRVIYHVNLAAYAAYAGDAQTAETESLKVRDQSPWALQSLALAQTLKGQVAEATRTYQQLAKSDLGPSYGTSGLGDLALYQGRFGDAVRLLTEGAAADLEAKEPDRAAMKLTQLAHAELLRQRKPAAIAAAEKALANSQIVSVRFMAARVLAEAGAPDRARQIAKALGRNLQAESQAYASIIDGMVALGEDDIRNAVRFLTDANEQLDTWIGHFELGRAYLAGSAFPQADSEFDRCLQRRGEALALFLDEEPTFGLYPPVYYYQAKVREGLKSAGSVESYKAYLAIRGTSTEDPLVSEIRKALGQ
jgi:tetratricopeptide (TPR) repeat protein